MVQVAVRPQLHVFSCRLGTGKLVINNRTLSNTSVVKLLVWLFVTFRALEVTEKYDLYITVAGGGIGGQAGAIRHGITRALIALDETLRTCSSRQAGFVTLVMLVKLNVRNLVCVEARKRPQFSKR